MKKVTIYSNFTEFSRTPQWSESCDQRLKMFLEGLEFFSMLGFFKTYLEKSYCDFKKCMVVSTPPWGARVNCTGHNLKNYYAKIIKDKDLFFVALSF